MVVRRRRNRGPVAVGRNIMLLSEADIGSKRKELSDSSLFVFVFDVGLVCRLTENWSPRENERNSSLMRGASANAGIRYTERATCYRAFLIQVAQWPSGFELEIKRLVKKERLLCSLSLSIYLNCTASICHCLKKAWQGEIATDFWNLKGASVVFQMSAAAQGSCPVAGGVRHRGNEVCSSAECGPEGNGRGLHREFKATICTDLRSQSTR